ncbi:MAG TPA: signal recognition particle-docking protein FtsY [Gemmatimonadaceae bacterium]|nr:signal recognition particle-docking protein FtsY [Gemmatimonadaceae bacterium]
MTRILRKADDLPRRSLWQRIKDVALLDVGVLVRGGVTPGSLERLEEILLEADFGVPVTMRLVGAVERLAAQGKVKTAEEFHGALAQEVEAALTTGRSDPALDLAARPTVILVVGVNGAGKTTFIGKLAARLKSQGYSTILAAGDTYRAGAIDQLRLWAERVGAGFIGGSPGGDPAAVAFSALDAAVARGVDVVIVDTAGRLHTQDDLMAELQKVARVIAKRLPSAPHETLLVIDGTIGQNAVAQAKTFAQSVPLTGVAVTKVDGTARGGIVVAVHEALDIPIKFVGVGEQPQDLVPFDPTAYAADLLRED